MSFDENLKAIRTKKGITQKSLGTSLGVTPVTVGNWERGIRQPSFSLLLKIADILETSTDALLGRAQLSSLPYFDMDAEDIAKKYRQLDGHGRNLVKTVCDIEYERVNHTANIVKFPTATGTKKISRNRFLPKYISPPAAGFGTPLEGEDFEMIRVDDNTPDNADYAVCISGDSMEPYIHDGDTVFVRETEELENGDVGIFSVNGEMYCKQYYIDDERNLHLLSANPLRSAASIHVSNDSGYEVRCCGKVLLDFDIPLSTDFD